MLRWCVDEADGAEGGERFAALEAWDWGSWMPSNGRDNDFRRVLYGMFAGVVEGLLMPCNSY